jgi:hypothetical protein
MRIADMLHAMAAWLESPNNEALLLAEYDQDCLKVVASSCVEAAAALKKAADQVENLEPPAESNITPESIHELAQIATAFDASGDPTLKRQASVIDELLLTIAAPPNSLAARKDLEDNRLEELKKKYENPRKELEKTNKMADMGKALDKSKLTKQYNILEAPLSTRYCPDHAGVQITRVGEHTWQCEMDKKTYNFETGFQLNDGSKVPGGDVSLQTSVVSVPYHATFDTREGRLGTNKP